MGKEKSMLTGTKEKVLKKASRVSMFEGEKPQSLGFADRRGTLTLTNQRLVYSSKRLPMRAILDSIRSTPAREKFPERLEIPLNLLTRVKSERYLGTAYLAISYKANNEEKINSFVFGEGLMGKSDWAKAIDSAKASLQTLTRAKYCVKCGSKIRDGSKFCVVCGHQIRSRARV